MKAYLVVDINVVDPGVFGEYVGRISDLITKHGGEYLVRGAQPTTVLGEGDIPQFLVVLEFPSRSAVEAFLEERDSTGLAELFSRGTNSRILLADGT